MAKKARLEETQRLTCHKCGNNKKFRGENTNRKVVYQNFKFTDYKKMGGEKNNEERNVVNYSPTFFAEGDVGYDIIYCADRDCEEKLGRKTVVYRRQGAKSFEALMDEEEVANRPNV